MNTHDPFEQMLEQEMQQAVAVVEPDVEAALNQVRGSATRAGNSHSNRPRSQWFLAVAAAVAIMGGGVFAADRLGQTDSDEIVAGGDSSTTVAQEPLVDETTVTTGPVTTVPGEPVTTVAESSVTSVTTVDDTSTTTVLIGQQFQLVEYGFFDGATGQASLVPFGTPQAEVVDLLGAFLGEPTVDIALEQCGRGQTSLIGWGAVSIYIDDLSGTVVGWALSEAGEGPAVTTGTSIELGSTVAEIKAFRTNVEIIDSTLGWQAWDGVMGWYLSGPNDSDIVVAMWAGEVCVYG